MLAHEKGEKKITKISLLDDEKVKKKEWKLQTRGKREKFKRKFSIERKIHFHFFFGSLSSSHISPPSSWGCFSTDFSHFQKLRTEHKTHSKVTRKIQPTNFSIPTTSNFLNGLFGVFFSLLLLLNLCSLLLAVAERSGEEQEKLFHFLPSWYKFYRSSRLLLIRSTTTMTLAVMEEIFIRFIICFFHLTFLLFLHLS